MILQGSVELGGVAPGAVPAGGTEVKAEPVNTQVRRVKVDRRGVFSCTVVSWCFKCKANDFVTSRASKQTPQLRLVNSLRLFLDLALTCCNDYSVLCATSQVSKSYQDLVEFFLIIEEKKL